MATLVELKSQVYDALVQIEQWQLKLKELNQAISEWKEVKSDNRKSIVAKL